MKSCICSRKCIDLPDLPVCNMPFILEFHNIPGMTSGNHQGASTETSNTELLSDDMLHPLFDRQFHTNRLTASWERTVLVWTAPEGTELWQHGCSAWLKPRYDEGEVVHCRLAHWSARPGIEPTEIILRCFCFCVTESRKPW